MILQVPRAERPLVERDGVVLLRSLRGDLWLASVPRKALTPNTLPRSVEYAWELRAEDRRSERFQDWIEEETRRGAIVTVRVKVFRDAAALPVNAAIRDAGGVVLTDNPALGYLDAELPASSVATLLETEGVRWVERNRRDPVLTNNDLRLDAEVNAVQSAGIDGAGVVFGMWDGGIADTTHPDLTGRVMGGEPGLFVDLHSCNVAGILMGDGTNSLAQGGGGLQWRGVATAAEMAAYDALDAVAEVDTAISDFDIDLSQNSWVYPVDDSNCDDYGDYANDAPEYDAIVLGAYGKPLPVIFAAGNERDDGDCSIVANGGYWTLPTPATAKNVISVGAHFSDAAFITPFSSWGPTDDGRMKPDLTAPGCQGSGDFGITSTSINDGYITKCGTSMAAPAVSGAAGMLFQAWRGIYTGDPRPATVKALLGGFAKDRANPGPDYRFGLGAIHVAASVHALQTATTIEDEVADQGVDSWTFEVPAGTDTLVVTLAWDDPVAAELADTTLVNDLDLVLLDPGAGTHLPFVLDPANPSLAATIGANRLDNVEQARVLSPAAGTWTAFIWGFDVPQGPQQYSLVGFDTRPPADPASAMATAAGDTTISLNWIRAGDADRAGTLVVRSESPVSWTPTDGATYLPGATPSAGVTVVAAEDADYSVTALDDTPLAPGTTFHYAYFSYDEIPNYSPGVAASAATTSDAVDAPVVASASRQPSFVVTGRHPVRHAAEFRLELPATAWVEITVHDVSGRRVATLVQGERTAGSHGLRWDGRSADGRAPAGGIYFVRIRTEGLQETRKIVLIR